jgi:hypothetical protein
MGAGTRPTTAKTTLRGVVTAAGGDPVKGAVVGARKHDTDDLEVQTKTDARGRYRLVGLRRRATYTLVVETDDGRHTVPGVRMTKQQQTEDISLPSGGSAMPTVPTTRTTDRAATGGGGGNGGDGGNGNGGAAADPAFDALLTLIDDPTLAPEPPVNVGEARELARLFVVSMYLLAGVVPAMKRLQDTKDAHYGAGDLAFQNMDDPALRNRVIAVLAKIPAPGAPNEEAELRAEVRAAVNLGTATVPAVNSEFAELYRRVVTLAADDNNGVDPRQVVKQEIREAAIIRSFLRDFKRALLRLTQNMSVYGTRGTAPLVSVWSEIVTDSIAILRDLGGHVTSNDQDDKAPWSILAALTDTPRGTVKSYVVNGRDGGALLRLTVGLYDAVQQSNDLDKEDDDHLDKLFFGNAREVISGLPASYDKQTVSQAFKRHGSLLRDYVGPLWP